MRATLTAACPEFARPANSSIRFDGTPAAGTTVGVSISRGMRCALYFDVQASARGRGPFASAAATLAGVATKPIIEAERLANPKTRQQVAGPRGSTAMLEINGPGPPSLEECAPDADTSIYAQLPPLSALQ